MLLFGLVVTATCSVSSALTKQLPLPKHHPIKTAKNPKKATVKKNNNQCQHIKKYDKQHKRFHYVLICEKPITFQEQLDAFLKSLTPAQQSALEKRISRERQIFVSGAGISFYEPTYALPFYYTDNPYQTIYTGNTPDNQRIDNEEFKGQLSFQFPIWYEMFGSNVSLNASYTQLSYWQIYAKSQFFRETNYEPQLFLSDYFSPSILTSFGVNHQSNGRGGQFERSWNRLFLDFAFSGEYWLIDIKPWVLIFTTESSNLHNPDIARYLGYGRVVIAIKFYNQEISLITRNTIESGFSRGAIEFDYTFPIHGLLRGYLQFFSGYGQSLIEYNHYTNSFGIGIAISDWI